MLVKTLRHRATLRDLIRGTLASVFPVSMHVALLARRLHRTQSAVQRACVTLAHQGEVHWCGPGLYKSNKSA